MKAALIEPPRWNGWPVLRADRCSRPAIYGPAPYPYWTASTAGYLRHHGVEVALLEADALDLTWADVKAFLQKERPDVVIFSAANCTVDWDLNTAQMAKEVDPKVKTLLIEPTLAPRNPQEILDQCPALDYICASEPEPVALSVCKGGTASEGIIHRGADGRPVKTPYPYFDITALPMPAYDLLPPLTSYPRIDVRASRGCPYDCGFCTLGSQVEAFGIDKRMRYRDPKIVLEELEYLAKQGVKHVFMADEVFTLHKKKAKELCDEIAKRNLGIKFSCQTRVDLVDEEVLTSMKKAGFWQVLFGVESGDDAILAKMEKDASVEEAKKAIALMRKVGIKVSTTNIIGFPGETLDSLRKTVELNKEAKPDVIQFAIATPLIGTRLWDECVKNNYLTVDIKEAERAIVGTHAIIKFQNMTPTQMYRGVRKGLLEINRAYWDLMPEGLVPKAKFIAKRLMTSLKVRFMPLAQIPGKAMIQL
jgi:radical SAM superfamily enzyme YgiQ (UPF0313 family)